MINKGQRVHVVGAGLAGLACAVALTEAGVPVTLYEAAGHAGGRCRSWRDPLIDREIDNGNHLLLSGNVSMLSYLRAIGAPGELTGPPKAALGFIDLATGGTWTLRPNNGRIPWWLLFASRRSPGGGALAHLRGLRALRAATDDLTVGAVLAADPLYRNLWQPMAVSILNTPAADASARLLWRVIEETLGAGGAACRPLVAKHSLGRTFVDPALAWLSARDVEIRFHARIRGFDVQDSNVAALQDSSGDIPVGAGDRVVLAVPATEAGALLPVPDLPDAFHAIVNAHFRLDRAVELPGGGDILGLIGGTAHWLFARGDVVSVTVSAADALAQRDGEAIAATLWADAAAALTLDPAAVPPNRIVKEKRATFSQTPEQAARRPATRTGCRNLYLAGDWTDTGIPATIEGAIRSGQAAAAAIRL